MTNKRKHIKIAAAFLTIVIAFSLFFVAGLSHPVKADNVKEIWTYKDLLTVADDPTGSYKLMADIDLKGKIWTPVDFSGTFDGDGHAILNVSINQTGENTYKVYDGNMKSYDTHFSGFFSALKDATVKNTKFLGVEVSVDTSDATFAGGNMENSTIENCTLYGKVTLYTSGKTFGVGGVAGFGNGSITASSSDMTLVCVDKDRSNKDEQFLGGAYAAGYIDLTDNTIQIDGYDSDHGYVHDGGLVGMYILYPEGTEHEGAITGNTVAGQITFFEDNEDRRAYCEAYIGEVMNWAFANDEAFSDENFTGTEVDDYDTVLLPHNCTDPQFEQTGTASTETENGFTEYRCATCGYSYKADFLPVIGNYVDPEEINNNLTPTAKAANQTASGKSWLIIVIIVVVLIIIAAIFLLIKKRKVEQQRLDRAAARSPRDRRRKDDEDSYKDS